jgi:hypothetical protein
MVKVWVVGDQIQYDELENEAMNEITSTCRLLSLHNQSVIDAVKIAEPDSRLLRYMAKQIAWDLRPGLDHLKINRTGCWCPPMAECPAFALKAMMELRDGVALAAEDPASGKGHESHIHTERKTRDVNQRLEISGEWPGSSKNIAGTYEYLTADHPRPPQRRAIYWSCW